MPRKQFGLAAEMARAGFSTRSINALIYLANITSIDELRTAKWEGEDGLGRRLRYTPNFGKKGFAEVEAFRAGNDPRTARPRGPLHLSIAFESDLIAKLDAWIAGRSKAVSRPEAIRAMVAAALEDLANDPKAT